MGNTIGEQICGCSKEDPKNTATTLESPRIDPMKELENNLRTLGTRRKTERISLVSTITDRLQKMLKEVTLYTPFEKDFDAGEDTDWDDGEKDFTFTRKGNSVDMFNPKILKQALRLGNSKVQTLYEQGGPFKIKPKDIPHHLDQSKLIVTCVCDEGDIYYGEWNFQPEVNNREGRGIHISPNGSLFEGFWSDGKMDGMGRAILSEGKIYQGEFIDGYYCGRGMFQITNQSLIQREDRFIHKGYYHKNSTHGIGFCKWNSGETYKGKFKNGTMTDKHGVYKFPDGSLYTGRIKNGKKHGEGTYKYSNGNIYHGNFKDDKLNGKGKFTWHDGSKNDTCTYEGMFMNNMKHGEGIMKKPGYHDLKVTFKNDKLTANEQSGDLVTEDKNNISECNCGI